MMGSSNFDFLASQDERCARLGAMAERYFFDDAPSALIKLRQLGEFIAKDVAAHHGLLPTSQPRPMRGRRLPKMRSLQKILRGKTLNCRWNARKKADNEFCDLCWYCG